MAATPTTTRRPRGRRTPPATPPLLQLLQLLVLLSAAAVASAAGRDLRRPHGRPRLDPEMEEYLLDPGDELSLRCQSPYPVRWEVPQEAKSAIEENRLYDGASDNPYRIYLKLPNLNYMQTGFYKCVDNATDDLEDGSRMAAIYVFVRDPNQLLAVEEDPVFLTFIEGGTLTVPCRPTAPDIDVTLEKDDELVDNNDVTFDPKIGFVLRPPSVFEVKCTAKKGDITSERSFAVNMLSVGNVPTPLIKAPVHAILNSALTLHCSVPYIRDVSIDLQWNYPAGESPGRVIVGVLKEENGFAVRKLDIKRTLDIDDGEYTCTASNHDGSDKKFDRKYIRVLPPDASYINLTVQGNQTSITTRYSANESLNPVQWVVYYWAHPEPELIWRGPDEKEIINKNGFIVEKDNTSTWMKIEHPLIQDTGDYSLTAVNQGKRETVKLHLEVTGSLEPTLTIAPYYMFNTSTQIIYEVIANPLPVVTWYFRACKHQAGEDCTVRESDALDTSLSEEIALGKVRLQSNLTFHAVHSGNLKAVACHDVSPMDRKNNCPAIEKKIFVTDVPDKFKLGGPRITVEGEKVEFTCNASVHFYGPGMKWKFNNELILGNSSSYLTTMRITELSYQSTLVVRNVSKADRGTYMCEVDSDNQTISLNVMDLTKPRFENGTNLLGNEIPVTEQQFLTLFCIASGIPKPTIVWYKGKVKVKSDLISNDGTRLIIPQVKLEDEGEYSCEVSNRAGTIRRSTTLSLVGKPKGVNIGLIVGLSLFAVLLISVIVYLFVRVRREQKLRQELTKVGLMNFEEGAIANLNMDLGVEDQAELLPYDRSFEFSREKLKLGKTLGSGAFGVVVKAEAFGIVEGEPVTPVAVKMVKRTADSAIIKALASELKIMVHLGRHLNVVNLLGACTKGLNKMELLVIVEYCRYGNLHNYLMKHRNKFIDQIDPVTGLIDPTRGVEALAGLQNGRNSGHSDSFRGEQHFLDSKADYRSQSDSSENFATGATEATFVCMTPTGEEGLLMSNNSAQPDWRSNYKGDYKGGVNPITTRDLLCYAFQVACGMEYLASRKVLHGDLAARNILLADNNIIKICDFGLAKSVYKDENYLKKENGPLPIKWMAIESIRDRIFSTQSDVWSFGIVVWEFFTLAKTPYTGMAADEHMYKKLEEGYRMEKPPYATDEIYTIMMDCWQARPILRPSFTELVHTLGSMLEDSVRKHYVDLNEPYVHMNNRWQSQAGHQDYLGMLNSPTYSNFVSPPLEEEEPQRYMNIPKGAPTVVADSNLPGYMTMKSPSPTDLNNVFSPTRPGSQGGNVFKFQTPPQGRRQLREAEVNDHVELRPMLSGGSRKSDSTSGHESDSDAMSQYTAVPSSRPVMPNFDGRGSTLKPINQSKLPSFSNPSYSFAPDLVTSLDNYVNYPKQRNINNQKPLEVISNIPTPTFSTFGRKPIQDVKLPANYANIPAQRAPLALSEADFNEPAYVN